jgi:predicted DCC family thiol-disulfide oxidoreductase YuxK
MDNSNSDILLFDGICNLCNHMVRFIIKRDSKGKFKFSSLQSEVGRQWLMRFDISGHELESFVLIQGGKYYIKSTAALRMLRELGVIWNLLYVFIWFPRPLRDILYDVVAKSRYKIFGKRDACMIPTPDLQARFL